MTLVIFLFISFSFSTNPRISSLSFSTRFIVSVKFSFESCNNASFSSESPEISFNHLKFLPGVSSMCISFFAFLFQIAHVCGLYEIHSNLGNTNYLAQNAQRSQVVSRHNHRCSVDRLMRTVTLLFTFSSRWTTISFYNALQILHLHISSHWQ